MLFVGQREFAAATGCPETWPVVVGRMKANVARISQDSNVRKDLPVIRGVHAQSVVFIGLESVEGLLQGGLWPGPQGHASTAELTFIGTRPDRLVVRIGEIRSAKKTASCSFQLESPKERFKPKVKGTLEFTTVPMRGRTKVILQGMADRELVGTLAPAETVRGVANEYVRQLLDEIARRLEELATREPAKAKAGP